MDRSTFSALNRVEALVTRLERELNELKIQYAAAMQRIAALEAKAHSPYVVTVTPQTHVPPFGTPMSDTKGGFVLISPNPTIATYQTTAITSHCTEGQGIIKPTRTIPLSEATAEYSAAGITHYAEGMVTVSGSFSTNNTSQGEHYHG